MPGSVSERTVQDEPEPAEAAPAPMAVESGGSFFRGLVIWLAILLPIWAIVIWKLFF